MNSGADLSLVRDDLTTRHQQKMGGRRSSLLRCSGSTRRREHDARQCFDANWFQESPFEA